MIMLNTWLQTLIQKDASKAMVYPYHGDENCVHLSLMVAINLNSLIDPESEGPLLKRIQIIRKQILFETGINIKGVRVCDADIPNNSYLIMYDKDTLAEGVIEPNASLGFSFRFIFMSFLSKLCVLILFVKNIKLPIEKKSLSNNV